MPELVNVPDVDGVPAVLFAPGAGLGIPLAIADAVGLPLFGGNTAQWGIFRGGQPVVSADTILAFDYKKDLAIADYPLERGSFESYNKVQIPFDVRFVYTAGGSEANRADLLASLMAIEDDLELYEAVTPEKVYPNVNIIHIDYRRTTQNGVGLLIVSVWCQQIRQVTASGTASASGNVGDAATASGADQVNSGAVQATEATPAQAANVSAQDFSGGYDVSGYNVNATYGGDVGEMTVTDATTGQALPGGTVPATSSTISGLSAAGPDTFTSLNIGTGGLS
jgi:hypothetical protein